MSIWKWLQSANSNGNADPNINFQEGQAPSTLNDAGRGLMAEMAKYRDDQVGSLVATKGTGSAYAVSSNSGLADLTIPFSIVTQFSAAAPGGAATLSVDGLTAKPLRRSAGVELEAGDVQTGVPYLVTWLPGASEFIVGGIDPRRDDARYVRAGSSLVISGPISASGGDLTAWRTSSPGTGALYLGNSGGRYLFWDGTTFTLNGPLYANGNISGGLYNGYTPFNSASFTAANVSALYGYPPFNGGGYGAPNPSLSGSTVVARDGIGRSAFCAGNGSGSGYAIVDLTYGRFGGLNWDGNGNVTFALDGSARGITTFASDARLKTNVAPTDFDALGLIAKIPFKSFDWAEGAGMSGHVSCGYLAQDLRDLDSDLASLIEVPGAEATLHVDAPRLLAIALRGLAQANARLLLLEAKG